MWDKTSGLTEAISGVNQVVNDVRKDPDALMLMQMAPYLDKLGISVPEVPDISSILIESLQSLVPNMNILTRTGNYAESIQADVKTKAFAIHQILGILEEHKKISSEQCTRYRKNVFTTAVDSITTIDELKNPINKAGKALDNIKSFFSETVKSLIGEEVKNEIKRSLKGSDKGKPKETENMDTKSTKNRDSKPEVNKKGGKQENQITKEKPPEEENSFWSSFSQVGREVLSFAQVAVATSQLASSLQPTNDFDISKNESYAENIDTYITEKKEIAHLKNVSGAKRVEREKEVDARIDRVANNDLGDDALSRAMLFTEKVLTKVGDVLTPLVTSLTLALSNINQDRISKHKAFAQIAHELNKGGHFNINELQTYQQQLSLQNPQALLERLETLKLDAREKGCNDASFYEDVNAQIKQVEELIQQYKNLENNLSESIQSLRGLKSDIEHYRDERSDSPLRDAWVEFRDIKPETGRTKEVKVSAANHLAEEVQTGKKAYGKYEDLALEEGDLSKKAQAFQKYKTRFQESVKAFDKPELEQEHVTTTTFYKG
ncbi:hypothetical protein BN59_00869 [Legionella massiliensis]|uniref:Uncharacterized protein n=1 Tax=Legionella massiliensis TaxID=1034943 RepID=A0A078KQD3_9GAMM|nr:hypothetical protein [Legionella massiliensis]CDZ76595.1 hypothetical protein BN59_00869 [Legionella massiliensis]CEE12333.1 hypothetical protein BN1094_00869 [Legionella massiliensis]